MFMPGDFGGRVTFLTVEANLCRYFCHVYIAAGDKNIKEEILFISL